MGRQCSDLQASCAGQTLAVAQTATAAVHLLNIYNLHSRHFAPLWKNAQHPSSLPELGLALGAIVAKTTATALLYESWLEPITTMSHHYMRAGQINLVLCVGFI